MKYFKKKKKDLSKIKTYQYNTTHDIRYLFNKITKEDYYKPIEIKSTFNGNYIEYESRGDKNDDLSLEDYLNIIRPYLRNMIDNHKAHKEWKIQLIMRIIFVSSLDTNEINLLMITNNKDDLGYMVVKNNEDQYDIAVNITNWHYLAIKNISGLLREITSNHNGDFYCLSCFHPYTSKGKT